MRFVFSCRIVLQNSPSNPTVNPDRFRMRRGMTLNCCLPFTLDATCTQPSQSLIPLSYSLLQSFCCFLCWRSYLITDIPSFGLTVFVIVLPHHIAKDKTKAFGIDSANVFGFWDWVGAPTTMRPETGHFFLDPRYSTYSRSCSHPKPYGSCDHVEPRFQVSLVKLYSVGAFEL